VFKNGKFKREPFGWRTELAREAKRRWAEGIFRYRVPKAREGETVDVEVGDRLTLAEWLTWRQPQYYGNNAFGWSEAKDGSQRPIPGGVNYALGWSFIYFLRTTKNEEYQKILPKYFNTLKSFVTQDLEAQEKALEEGGLTGGDGEKKDGEGGQPGEGGDAPNPEGGAPTAAEPKQGETTDVISRGQWHGESLKEATRGLDLEQLEKDWLEHSW
jgi:hypothetical protein